MNEKEKRILEFAEFTLEVEHSITNVYRSPDGQLYATQFLPKIDLNFLSEYVFPKLRKEYDIRIEADSEGTQGLHAWSCEISRYREEESWWAEGDTLLEACIEAVYEAIK